MNLNISENDVPNAWWIMNSLLINVELRNNTSFSYTIQHINVLLCIRILSKKQLLYDKYFHVYFTHRINPTIRIINSKFDKWQFWQIIWNRFGTNIKNILQSYDDILFSFWRTYLERYLWKRKVWWQ
jgi:hypothetical protein